MLYMHLLVRVLRNFDAREINIRMEYRFCPNMILIDTPGLIQAPRGKHLNSSQQALLRVSAYASLPFALLQLLSELFVPA